MWFVLLSFSSLPNIFYRHWRKKRQSFYVATVTMTINTCTGINRRAMAVLWSLLECLVMAQLLKRINSNLDLTSQDMQKRMHSCSYPAYLLRTVQCISVQQVNTAIQFPITANKKLFMLHLFDNKNNTHTRCLVLYIHVTTGNQTNIMFINTAYTVWPICTKSLGI